MHYQKLLQRTAMTICLLGATNTQANLIDRGNGMIYDQDLNVTWLQDANVSGQNMSWEQANNWASNLVWDIYSDWRLPNTLEISGALPTDGEVGHMFFEELGGTEGQDITWSHGDAYDLFSNLNSGRYWTGTDRTADGDFAWAFLSTGIQNYVDKSFTGYAWAVRSGDVKSFLQTVPIPGAVWMFLSTVLIFLGVARRRGTP